MSVTDNTMKFLSQTLVGLNKKICLFLLRHEWLVHINVLQRPPCQEACGSTSGSLEGGWVGGGETCYWIPEKAFVSTDRRMSTIGSHSTKWDSTTFDHSPIKVSRKIQVHCLVLLADHTWQNYIWLLIQKITLQGCEQWMWRKKGSIWRQSWQFKSLWSECSRIICLKQ